MGARTAATAERMVACLAPTRGARVGLRGVKTHVSRAVTTRDARDRARLVVYAHQAGLVSPPVR
ncbi:hypothetical protein GCM10009809_11870 [Isoptericola hypogeus]|uniref:Uncharacterized protein n=1 Tax=Isoptericola hypogeus TaxID=300179 RepID=A0ABN2J3Z9_9MICO